MYKCLISNNLRFVRLGTRIGKVAKLNIPVVFGVEIYIMKYKAVPRVQKAGLLVPNIQEQGPGQSNGVFGPYRSHSLSRKTLISS